MSKETTPDFCHGNGYVIYEHTPNQIIGKILTLIEVAGMSEKQERSVKSLIEQAVWDTIRDFGILITGKTHSELRVKHSEEIKNPQNQDYTDYTVLTDTI